jgi:surface antigen
MNRHREKYVSLAVLVLACNVIAGCANRQYATPEEAIKNACSAFGPKALSGTLIGGAAGAAGGAAIGAAAGGGRDAAIGALAGLLVGAVVGTIAGHVADGKDCEQAHLALQKMNTTPTGVQVAWNNSASGSYGSYTPISDATTINDHVCREIRADYFIKNHQPVTGETGLVCRTPDGDWARVATPS